MQKTDIAATLVALHREAGYYFRRSTARQRAEWLQDFLRADLGPERLAAADRPIAQRLGEIRERVQAARAFAIRVLRTYTKRRTATADGTVPAIGALVVEEQLEPLLSQLRLEFERDPASLLRKDSSGRVKLPLNVGYVARNLEAAIGLAVIEELTGAQRSGLCPFCGEWWISRDVRRRRACGRPECTTARKGEWRKQHPEPAVQVAARVRRHRRKGRRR